MGPPPTTTKWSLSSFSLSLIPGWEAYSKPMPKSVQAYHVSFNVYVTINQPLSNHSGVVHFFQETGILFDTRDPKCLCVSAHGNDKLIIIKRELFLFGGIYWRCMSAHYLMWPQSNTLTSINVGCTVNHLIFNVNLVAKGLIKVCFLWIGSDRLGNASKLQGANRGAMFLSEYFYCRATFRLYTNLAKSGVNTKWFL